MTSLESCDSQHARMKKKNKFPILQEIKSLHEDDIHHHFDDAAQYQEHQDCITSGKNEDTILHKSCTNRSWLEEQIQTWHKI